jgi:hypothetical protein
MLMKAADAVPRLLLHAMPMLLMLVVARPLTAQAYSITVTTDLNSLLPDDSGWALTSASGINDEGQIVGVGLHDGRWRGFLLDRDRVGARR